jgi:hypothetical protein
MGRARTGFDTRFETRRRSPLRCGAMHALGRRTAVSLVLWLLGTGVASAQAVPRLDIERFTPALGPDAFLSVQGTRTYEPGRYRLALWGGYEGTPLALGGASPYDLQAVRSRLALWLGGEVGLLGRLAIGALLPAYPYQRARFDTRTPAFDETPGFALGDARVHARYRVLGESSASEDPVLDGPGVAVEARGLLPTSSDDAVAGEQSFRTELHLLGDFHLLGAGVAGDLGVRVRFEGVRMPLGTETVPVNHEFLFGAALKVPLPPAPFVVTVLEVSGATDFRSAEATSVELTLGAHVLLGAFTLSAAGGLGLTRGFGTPDGRVLLAVSFSPVESDQDGDGVDDDADGCPFLAEDTDGFQDRDGCPDPDNDNDLIPDLDDLCPSETAEEGKDEDEDGCTDGTEPKK